MAGLKRFFVENVGETAVLEGEEFDHARSVLRLGVGDEVELLDNSGKRYTAVIAECTKKQMLLNVLSVFDGDKEAKTAIALAFGYLKNADKNEFIVQKGVELGVKRMIAFSSAYSSAYMSENKLQRLQKVAKESAKQCLREAYPEVDYCDSLEKTLERLSGYDNKLFACEFAAVSEVNLATLKGSTAIVIGSEGGFSKEEADLAKAKGFSLVSLGKRILRAETAAVALTSVVAFALGELGEQV